MTEPAHKPPNHGDRRFISKLSLDPDAIVATNDSSIVSKRSVEKLYVANRSDHLLRHFVSKFQRRSPMINRGYWLRMQLIKQTIENFLESDSGVPKHIINLGCGFDPISFHYLRSYPKVGFFDIDYPKSIRRKSQIIQETPEIHQRLTDPIYRFDSETVVLTSANYFAVGVDLNDLEKLSQIIKTHCNAKDELLFISEVAITYMPVDNADALIKWAAQFSRAKFALIEQILPAGENHHFARTMLSHFRKINSPLQNIGKYPNISSQLERFYSFGWNKVHALNFYDAWCQKISDEQKTFVNSIEPFDEWEDFVIFGQHYFFLYASLDRNTADDDLHRYNLSSDRFYATSDKIGVVEAQDLNLVNATLHCHKDWQPAFGRHKFGAAAKINETTFIYHGGTDSKTRSNTSYALNDRNKKISQIPLVLQPSPRVCHTLTHIGDGRVMLVGGRGNPNAALVDCWLFKNSKWTRVQDLPEGRYRHCATHVSIGDKDYVLCFGGRGPGTIVYGNWLIWSEATGWSELASDGQIATPRFSACLAWFPETGNGILTGGFVQSGEILSDIGFISFANLGFVRYCRWDTPKSYMNLLCRGGGRMIPISSSQAMLAGGVSGLKCSAADLTDSFVLIDILQKNIQSLIITPAERDRDLLPILLGCDYVWLQQQLHIIGGGIIAFSMGAYWNLGTWVLQIGQSEAHSLLPIQYHQDLKCKKRAPRDLITSRSDVPIIQAVRRCSIRSMSENSINVFDATKTGTPILFENLSFGECVSRWNPEYLKATVGNSREVIVHLVQQSHQSSPFHLNFNTKNFRYQPMVFPEFIDLAFSEDSTELCYLRTISQKPTKLASLFERDFPELSSDFRIPSELSFIKEALHSSPLRISSAGIGMWLHYDVCANFLFQIRGEKKILLFPPTDIGMLQFPAGKTTSSIPNIFEAIPPGTNPREVIMSPGDTLYIPPLWLHAVLPLSACIAINTFFNSFDINLNSRRKDLYGNRDLACYEEGREIIKKLEDKFQHLDDTTRRFYIMRLGHELLENAASTPLL